MAVLIPVVEIKNWSSIMEPIRSDILDASPAPGAPQTRLLCAARPVMLIAHDVALTRDAKQSRPLTRSLAVKIANN